MLKKSWSWRRILASTATRSVQRPRLRVEALEDRSVPATHTWTALGGSFDWSDAGNWDAAGKPTSNEPGGTIVVMPVNDDPVQDIPNLTIASIEFKAPTAVTLQLTQPLTIDGTAASDNIINTSGNNTITGSSINLVGGSCFIPVTGGSLTIVSPMTGNVGMNKFGPNTLTLGNGDTGANTYTGSTTVADGTLVLNKADGTDALTGSVIIGDGTGTDILRLQNNNQINDGVVLTFDSGGDFNSAKFELNGFDETVAGIATLVAGQVPVIQNTESVAPAGPNEPAVLTINNTTHSTYDGIIRNNFGAPNGTLALVKRGIGTLTRSDTGGFTSDYSGGTTIEDGTLQYTNVKALGTGDVTLGNAATPAGHTPKLLAAATTDTTLANNIIVRVDGSVIGSVDDAVNIPIATFSGTVPSTPPGSSWRAAAASERRSPARSPAPAASSSRARPPAGAWYWTTTRSTRTTLLAPWSSTPVPRCSRHSTPSRSRSRSGPWSTSPMPGPRSV